MFPLSLSLVALSCLSFTGAEPLHLPLMRKRTSSTVDNLATSADLVRYKYGIHSDSTPSKRQTISKVQIINEV